MSETDNIDRTGDTHGTGSTDSAAVLRARLGDIDEQIARLRGESAELVDQVGGQGVGAQDENDRAAALTNSDENAALIATLQQRRERVEAELAEQE